MAPPMRLAFMGSPDFAVPALRALVAAGHEVAAVYAQPPRPAGRGQRETPCPVHRAALELAAARIQAYHARQLPEDARWRDETGAELGWRWTPVDAAGLRRRSGSGRCSRRPRR